jgi:hypothetical protein
MTKKALLSILWISVALNYVFRFLFSLYYPERLQQLLSGNFHGMEATQEFILGISVIMEVPILMIVLSLLLKYRINRFFNMAIGAVFAAIHITSLRPDMDVTLHYYFFTAIGLILCVCIFFIALKWKTEEIPKEKRNA